MKRTKRLLSTLLALCMVLAMLSATAMAAGSEPVITDRYTVLVLDCSGSMWGNPMEKMKESAKKFCATVKADTTNNVNNHVAVVSFDSMEPDVVSDFTADMDTLNAAIDRLSAGGGTYIENAIQKAAEMLTPYSNNEAIITNIILLTDGIPEHGTESRNNMPYTSNDSSCYKVANQVYARAISIWKAHNLYTLGFFHRDLSGQNAIFGRRFLRDISNAGYWEVTNPDLLNVEFEEIAGGITSTEKEPEDFKPGQEGNLYPYIQVIIRCPVDVSVKYRNHEILNSSTSTTTSAYGTLTVEQEEGISGTTKTLNLFYNESNPKIYNIELTATGAGEVKISATHYNADGTPKDPLISKDNPQQFSVATGKTYRTSIYNVTGIKETVYNKYPLFVETTEVDVGDTGGVNNGTDSGHFTYVPTTVGGTVVLSKRNAEPGDWVNVYVTPDEGYKLESLTVTDMRGWPVTLREMGENAFSFTMPNARINVNPVFVKVEADDDPYSTNVPTNIPNIEGTSPNYGNMVINTAAMNYSDVNAGDWFYNNVKFCHERYLLNKTGEADGKFEPNTASTRATVWTALSRLAGRNTVTQGDNWYDRAQIWAKGKGITDGERPMDSMTREEFVTMLWRYDGNKYVQNSALGQFNDGESVSWWATEAVKWAVATGLLNGSNGSLNPQSNVTRAEVAAVLQRYVQNVH